MIVSMQVGDNWDLFLADARESAPLERLTTSEKVDISPTLSPDLATMIYVNNVRRQTPRRLRIAGAADGSGDRPLFDPVPSECAHIMSRPAWHPTDPNILALPCSDDDGRSHLYLIRLNGTIVREIKLDEDRVGDPTFSPDGKRLVFWGDSGDLSKKGSDDDGGTLYLVAADGKGPVEQLTKPNIQGQDSDAAWSPTSDVIAFRRRADEGPTQIYSMTMKGTRKVESLTSGPGDKSDPSWSPSGAEIAFKSSQATDDVTERDRVWVMDADGGDPHVLWTKNAASVQGAPSWSRR